MNKTKMAQAFDRIRQEREAKREARLSQLVDYYTSPEYFSIWYHKQFWSIAK
tara:strand:- start:179 stop:334 length:156 start_codon:yes stop_codon:yes gene_type:complete